MTSGFESGFAHAQNHAPFVRRPKPREGAVLGVVTGSRCGSQPGVQSCCREVVAAVCWRAAEVMGGPGGMTKSVVPLLVDHNKIVPHLGRRDALSSLVASTGETVLLLDIFEVSWCLCGVPGPDPIAKAAGSSPAPAALVESTDPAWPQAPGKSRVVSKRARGLRPSRNMPANQNSPGPSLALTAGGRDNSCEGAAERRRSFWAQPYSLTKLPY
nr:uncharacterized protein LOC106832709 [Equus asinus]